VRTISVRSLVFWPHLVAGVLAGAVILIMSVTGVLLTYEKQMIAWADSRVTLSPEGARLDPETLVERIRAGAGATPVSMVVSANSRQPILASVGQKSLLVDPYSGAVLGESAPRLRRFFRQVTDWHRWLAMGGEQRTTGRALTGWSNVVFFFLAVSGMYLWLPKVWSWRHVRTVAWFSRGVSGKARDFNWHNVIGFWCAPVIVILTATGMVISYTWASNLVYTLTGSPRPVAAGRGGGPGGQGEEGGRGGGGRGEGRGHASLESLVARAERQVPTWRTMIIRLPPRPGGPVALSIVGP